MNQSLDWRGSIGPLPAIWKGGRNTVGSSFLRDRLQSFSRPLNSWCFLWTSLLDLRVRSPGKRGGNVKKCLLTSSQKGNSIKISLRRPKETQHTQIELSACVNLHFNSAPNRLLSPGCRPKRLLWSDTCVTHHNVVGALKTANGLSTPVTEQLAWGDATDLFVKSVFYARAKFQLPNWNKFRSLTFKVCVGTETWSLLCLPSY